MLLFLSIATFSACAREAPEATSPPVAGGGWIVPANYAWPPTTIARERSGSARAPSASASALNAETNTTAAPFAEMGNAPRPRVDYALRDVLPGGTLCLARLSERGVRYRRLEHELGVKTPIAVDGAIAGVRFYTGANGPLIADCRLVLALDLVLPNLSAMGVSDVRFSGAYVYRLSNKGRVSLHAYGLAIDMHGFTRLGVHYEVQRDFKKGLGASLRPDAPAINAIAERFRQSGLFHEYLTPDDNSDHHDHVHVGVSPLPDES
jgi:hypothetical protein